MDYFEYKDLVTEMSYFCSQYYNHNRSPISDKEYDEKFKQLEQWEEENPDEVALDSPTQRVGVEVSSGHKKVKRETKMYSLDNSYDTEDVNKFVESVRALNPHAAFSIEPKIDGASIEITYKDGKYHFSGALNEVIDIKDIYNPIVTLRRDLYFVYGERHFIIRLDRFSASLLRVAQNKY